MAWGAAGVVAFSLTFPASRAALPAFGPVTVGLGRAVLASVLAAACLLAVRAPRPSRRQAGRLALVAVGVVIGFPICSSLALTDATSAHGAVLVGLLPAATAVVAVLRDSERPPPTFWLACAGGLVAVLVFAAVAGAGRVRAADLWLLAAVALGALGYAEGGAVARELGGWQVISWALLMAFPPLAVITAFGLAQSPPHGPTPGAWIGLAYVSVVSMFAGFVAWYRGLAEGGVAHIAQLQLAQPVLTMVWSVLLLAEHVTASTVLAGLVVVAMVAVTQATRRRPVPERPADAQRPSGQLGQPHPPQAD